MSFMLTIIVPTDFSPTTAIALRVAADLAQKTGFNFEAVHFHDGIGDTNAFLARQGKLESQAAGERKLEEFIRFNIPPGSIPADILDRLSLQTIKGEPAEELLKISKSQETAIIIMGASGQGVKNNSSIFYGSVAQAVCLKAECPILLIPKDAEDKIDFTNIAYSFEAEAPLREMTERIGHIFEPHAKKVYYLHLEDDNPDVEAKEMAFLKDGSATFMSQKGEVKILEVGELIPRLGEASRKEDIDLLIVGHRHRGALDSFFVRSKVKPLLHRSTVPLLIVPIEKY